MQRERERERQTDRQRHRERETERERISFMKLKGEIAVKCKISSISTVHYLVKIKYGIFVSNKYLWLLSNICMYMYMTVI